MNSNGQIAGNNYRNKFLKCSEVGLSIKDPPPLSCGCSFGSLAPEHPILIKVQICFIQMKAFTMNLLRVCHHHSQLTVSKHHMGNESMRLPLSAERGSCRSQYNLRTVQPSVFWWCRAHYNLPVAQTFVFLWHRTQWNLPMPQPFHIPPTSLNEAYFKVYPLDLPVFEHNANARKKILGF